MKTEYKIIAVMMVLISSTLFLISQNPNESPKSRSFEKYSEDIIQINQESKKYELVNDMQNYNASKRLMEEKLKDISFDYLGIKVSDVLLLDGYYPFKDVEYRIEKYDLDPSSICDFEKDIPLHMKKISQTENFQKFAKKYSAYPIELDFFDERNAISNIHYGLIATNGKNQSASTYFHLDSCTNEISDKEPYFLNCSDKNDDYRFATFNSDHVLSSYSNGDFCKIVLDSWRQSLFEYSKTLREKRLELRMDSMEKVDDPESQWEFISKMNRQGELGNLVAFMIHYNFDEQSLQEKIEEYEKQHGPLPEELQELMENR